MPKWKPMFGGRSTSDEVLAGIDLSGRLAVVTGANSGIGLDTARALAGAGASVIMACRDRGRGTAAMGELQDRQPNLDLEVGEVDLASQQSVRAFAAGLSDRGVDIVVCNAGIYAPTYKETAEGIESTVGICHVGHFLLVHQLLPALEASPLGRLVLVSSESHRQLRTLDIDVELPLRRDNYRPMRAYAQAKLCNVLHASEVHRRYGDRGVVAVSLHPGNMVPTGIGRESRAVRVLLQVLRPFTKTLAQGSATSALCAGHFAVSDFGGAYFVDAAPKPASKLARDPMLASALWDRSLAWCGL